MPQPTATSQGAERQPMRQRGTHSGCRLDSSSSDSAEQATEAEQHDAAAHTVTSRGAKRRLKMQRETKSGRSIDSGDGDSVEHAAELEQHGAAAHRGEPRSGEAAAHTA